MNPFTRVVLTRLLIGSPIAFAAGLIYGAVLWRRHSRTVEAKIARAAARSRKGRGAKTNSARNGAAPAQALH